MKFYKTKLILVDPIAHAYPNNQQDPDFALNERLPGGKCDRCGHDEWWFLPDECVGVRTGGKPYIECMKCGGTTHL